MSRASSLEERVLVLAPFGRDARLAAEVLGQAGMAAHPCADMHEVCAELFRGAGAILVAEESLTPEAEESLAAELRHQPPWSDLPVAVLTSGKRRRDEAQRAQKMLGVLGNVTFIERPMRVPTLVTAMKAALRARTRQYEARATLEALARQEAEARKRADFERQLIGIVSHDLRNPLHAILLSAASLVKPAAADERMARNVARIQTSAQRATRLIRDLLDYTQAQLGGGIRIAPSQIDLHAVIRAAVEEVEQTHPDRKIDFSAEGPAEGEYDGDRIAQVVTNLLTNALTYGEPGSPVLARIRGEADWVTFEVCNSGPPISDGLRSRLFEPMERGAAAHGDSSRSIGLGLFIVRNIVIAHRGSIDVRSNAKDGTTFTVRLPRHPPKRRPES